MGKTIVYGNRNSVMDAVMFGPTRNERKEQAETAKNNFRGQRPKNTPQGSSPRPNVKDDSGRGKDGSPKKQWKPRQLSPEEIDLKEREKIMAVLLKAFTEFGDDVKESSLGYLVLNTGVITPRGEIVLKVSQDVSAEPSAVVVCEEGELLYDYIYEQDSPRETKLWIFGLVEQMNAAGRGNFELSFDGKGIYALGDKKECTKMKWAIVDLLNRIFDEDEDCETWG